jgi:phage terminase small subunit
MARPRTATKILELRGSFKHDPQRKRPNEPVARGAFPKNPPRYLTPGEKRTWREIVRHTPAGVLTDADVFQVEAVARLIASFRETESPPMQMYQRIESMLGKLGLHPSSRAGLVVDKPKQNKYAE